MSDLHPLLAELRETYRRTGRPQMSSGTPADGRALVASSRTFLGPGPADVAAVGVRIPTRDGAIAGRLLLPPGDREPAGVVVYLHGGGWVLGTLDDFDALGRHLAARSGCAVLLADYRLAPEHPFPAGLHDTEDTLRQVASGALAAQHPALAAGRPLVVAGDSAGGNLATVAAAAVCREVPLALQLLVYPVTDARMATRSYEVHAHDSFLTRADMVWFYRHYAPDGRWNDPRISPLQAAALGHLPPAWIAVAEHDVLHDEGIAYAERLAEAGVPVTVRRCEGVTHGCVRMMNILEPADRLVDAAAAAIRAACARKTSPSQETA
ncbi:alpha/beta hydrolase [Piscinibacter sakaiensis]|uniref:Esterase/lipase n=1 Tax=Piscinibacter sakaiensis TaxID=1547922 RepID=A0A0K8NYD7_PISS1|nr:alpha/beta hydrolase [Piscinibacter sakaiensis]GAP35396.1 esterase/lipase [Piscinibacter sakaiensis]